MTSCGEKVFYYSNNPTTDSIDFNGEEEFYVSKRLSNVETPGIKSFKYNDTSDRNFKVTDIHVLIINKKKNLVFFISTIPSKWVFDEEDTYLIDEKIPNSFFFNKFYIGKIKDSLDNSYQIEFSNDKEKQVWNITKEDSNHINLNFVDLLEFKKNGQTIKKSNTMYIEDCYPSKLIFEKINEPTNATIGFKIPEHDKSKIIDRQKLKSISFDRQNQKINRIILSFTSNIIFNGNNFNSIEFPSERVPYFIF